MKTKADYKRMLSEGYGGCAEDGELSRLEYLSEYIFGFSTYDTEKAEEFAQRAVEVCAAISGRATLGYIEDSIRYRWYLLMCNMPFFADRIEWGTSILGAWWNSPLKLQSLGLWLDGEQLSEEMEFSADEWEAFIAAVVEFAAE